MSETMFEQEPNPSQEPQSDSEPTTASRKAPLSAFVDHQTAAAREAALALQALIPPDFRTHSRAARKEFLSSFKVLLDGVSDMVDHELEKARAATAAAAAEAKAAKSDDQNKPPTTGKTKVKVEVL